VSSAMTNPATNGMLGNVTRRRWSASIDMCASPAGGTTRKVNAKPNRPALEPRAKCPCYTRGLLCDDDDNLQSLTAQWSLTVDLIPPVPAEEFNNLAAANTIWLNL
jgi:hypothetical protein